MHAGNLCNIVQCKIVCSDYLIWKVGRIFGYVVNKYLSKQNNFYSCLVYFCSVNAKYLTDFYKQFFIQATFYIG